MANKFRWRNLQESARQIRRLKERKPDPACDIPPEPPREKRRRSAVANKKAPANQQ
jgi:hypothetical protein